MKSRTYKILVVAIVAAAVSAAVLIKVKSRRPSLREEASGPARQSLPEAEDMQAIPLPELEELKKMEPGVLATVNTSKITEEQLNLFLAQIPPQQRAEVEGNKAFLLESLIVREVLLQEAKKRKVGDWPAAKENIREHPAHRQDILIQALLQTEAEKVSVSDGEARQFFDANPQYFTGATFDAMKERIKAHLLGEKQNERVNEFVEELRLKAKVVKNEEWARQQEALRPDTPLDIALKSGRVVFANLGKMTCVPCKMIRPIIDKLGEEYKGRAEILYIDLRDYPALGGKYGIRAIPTQILFDKNGKEVYRHMGFMPEEAIIEKLKEVGIK